MIQSLRPVPDAPLTALDIAPLELTVENADRHLQLAETQERCIEMAVDAGDLQADIEALRSALTAARMERDAAKAQLSSRSSGR